MNPLEVVLRQLNAKVDRLAVRETRQAAWVTPALSGVWISVEGVYPDAGYRRDTTQTVYLRGRITGGSGAIFTLPEGFRPSHTYSFGVVANGAFGVVSVDDGGVVSLVSGDSPVSLDGIAFRAEL